MKTANEIVSNLKSIRLLLHQNGVRMQNGAWQTSHGFAILSILQ